MIEITSATNPRYKTWLKLLEGRGIKKSGQALLAGPKIIREVLAQFPKRALGLITRRAEEASDLDLPPETPVYLLPGPLFAALDIYGIKAPILIISAPPPPPWDGSLPDGLTIFLPFQNPINLGTCIRSAAAFGASVVLLTEAATPYLPKCLRASGPAVFQVPLFQGPGLQELAAMPDLPVYALSADGRNIHSFAFPERAGLVAGMEGPGLDAFWPRERRLSIPMRPGVESLNAAVAMSIGMALREAAAR